eukprot:2667976-Pleurochrysis_carterae.AAC.1
MDEKRRGLDVSGSALTGRGRVGGSAGGKQASGQAERQIWAGRNRCGCALAVSGTCSASALGEAGGQVPARLAEDGGVGVDVGRREVGEVGEVGEVREAEGGEVAVHMCGRCDAWRQG